MNVKSVTMHGHRNVKSVTMHGHMNVKFKVLPYFSLTPELEFDVWMIGFF